MIKQKFQTFLLTCIPFGLSVSFSTCFLKKENWIDLLLLFVAMIAIIICADLPKVRKKMLPLALNMQPLAAVLFASSVILSFFPCRMAEIQLIIAVILNAVCLCLVFERQNFFHKKISFVCVVLAAALSGGITVFLAPFRLISLVFVLAALLCRPASENITAQDIWKDLAFPVFVLVGAFLVFISASHMDAFSLPVAQAAVMVMTGALLISCRGSGLRLMLMTLVMIVFGSYVFSVRSPDSFFYKTTRVPVKIEKKI